MQLGAALGTLIGVGLTAWLIARYGVQEVVALLGQAGWGIALVTSFHLVQIVLSAAGWRALANPASPRPSLGQFVVLRWIREGLNNLLPVAQVGGLVVATRQLHQLGVKLSTAVAWSVGDLTVEVATQALFTLLGLSLLLATVGGGDVAAAVLGGLGVAAVAIGGFVAAQWFGLGLVEHGIARVGAGLGWASSGEMSGLRDAIRDVYRAPRRLLASGAQHGVSWVLGGVEVCLALHFLGHDVSLVEGVVIEALGQALKAVGFAVPGALGVAEVGYILACGLYGVAPEAAIALSLTKRLREIILGVPALIAWQMIEGRRKALP